MRSPANRLTRNLILTALAWTLGVGVFMWAVLADHHDNISCHQRTCRIGRPAMVAGECMCLSPPEPVP